MGLQGRQVGVIERGAVVTVIVHCIIVPALWCVNLLERLYERITDC
jgi:hypothetical protein